MERGLQGERRRLSFDPTQITFVLDGGRERTYRRRFLENLVLRDADFRRLLWPPYSALFRQEALQRAADKMAYLAAKIKDWNLTDHRDIDYIQRVVFPNELGTAELLTHNYVTTVLLTATDDQCRKWVPRIRAFQVVPYFAQTELGHGSNVRGLETIAAYDKETQQFILNTPTLTSLKWWCTTVGHLSRWAVIVARLVSDGRDYGQGHFFVPLFAEADDDKVLAGTPTSGLTTGDIGPCLGLQGLSFRFIKLVDVRVPRDNLLARQIEITEDGVIRHKTSYQVSSYIGVARGRCMLCSVAARALSQAVTMAIRYSCTPGVHASRETRQAVTLMDRQTQQHKLLPLLAKTYAFWLTGSELWRRQEAVSQQIFAGNDITEALKHLHGATAGLKALLTRQTGLDVEACRLACPGLTSDISSAFAKIYTSFASLITADGETTVMFLQTARYLLQHYTIKTPAAENVNLRSLSASAMNELFLPCVISILQTAFHRELEREKARMRRGNSLHRILQERAVPLVAQAKLHAAIQTLTIFNTWLCDARADPDGDLGGDLRATFRLLGGLYGVTLVLENAGSCLQEGTIDADDVTHLEELQLSLCHQLRPLAVGLTDAFDHRDEILQCDLASGAPQDLKETIQTCAG